MSEKMLLDTDIGSDIDDALCLAYLLAQPQCDLLGITTVSGAPDQRAMLASALCKHAGQPIPIYPGAADPLVVAQQQPAVPQAVALARWEHDTHFPRGAAVEFLRQTIRRHPGEITLLTLGPLTNIALLFRTDPDIPALLKSLVMMAGVFTDPGARRAAPCEWNALLDPHATAIVYRATPPVHRSIGLDVTTQVVLPAAVVRPRLQTRLLRPVLDLAELWFQQCDVITFHDPLAAATIFDPTICHFTAGAVEVVCQQDALLGQTRWQPGPGGPHAVALGVQVERFFHHYFSVLGFPEDWNNNDREFITGRVLREPLAGRQ